jgi:hypothetical protein
MAFRKTWINLLSPFSDGKVGITLLVVKNQGATGLREMRPESMRATQA